MDFEYFVFMGMVIVAVIMIVALSETNKNLAKHNRELVSEVKKWKKKYATKIKFFVELVKELRVKIQKLQLEKTRLKATIATQAAPPAPENGVAGNGIDPAVCKAQVSAEQWTSWVAGLESEHGPEKAQEMEREARRRLDQDNNNDIY